MNMIFKKLRSRAGESLVESLAAILVVTMASIVMYSMVTAAADINLKAKNNDRAVQEQMAVAERGDGTGTEGTIKMYIQNGNREEIVATVPVNVYGGLNNGELYAYYVKGGG